MRSGYNPEILEKSYIRTDVKYLKNIDYKDNDWESDFCMEANKRNYQRDYTRTSYIEGNTVRKLNVVPDHKEEQYEVPSPRRQDNRHTKSLSSINITSLLILTVAIAATLFLCVDYIKVQSDINHMEKTIASKQEELITLTKNNDAAYETVNTTYDLKHIYQIAVEEYGMVYPGNDAVITYQGSDNDYVRQYEDIPN